MTTQNLSDGDIKLLVNIIRGYDIPVRRPQSKWVVKYQSGCPHKQESHLLPDMMVALCVFFSSKHNVQGSEWILSQVEDKVKRNV